MNFVSNSCVGANIMKYELNIPYCNPFCWNLIDFDSFYTLINEWDNIDFDNIKLIKFDGKDICGILIDEKVLVRYVHYHRSQKDLAIRKDGVEVYFNNIEEYVISSYRKRLERMKERNEEPIFVIGSSWWHGEFTSEQIDKFLSIDTKYKMVFVGNERNVSKENVLFVECKVRNNNGPLAKDIYERFIK